MHTILQSVASDSDAEEKGKEKDEDHATGSKNDEGGEGDIVGLAKGVHQLRSVPKNRELMAVVEEMDRMSGIAGDAKEVGNGFFEFGDLNDDFMLFASQPADDEDEEGENDARSNRRAGRANRAAADDDAAHAMDEVPTSGAAFMQETDVQLRLLDECFDALALREYNDDEDDDEDKDDYDEFGSERDDYDDYDDEGGEDASCDGSARRQRSQKMGADISEFDHVLDEYLEKTRAKKYLTENDDLDAAAESTVASDTSGLMSSSTPTTTPDATAANRGIGSGGVQASVDDMYRAFAKKPYKEGGSLGVRFNIPETADATLQDDDEEDQDDKEDDADTDDRSQYYDGKFSYIDREREWVEISSARARNNDEDIESCVSFRTTVSTPSIIPMVRTLGVPHKSRGQKNQNGLAAPGEDGVERKIVLSNKTGLPIGYHPGDGRNNTASGIASEPAGSDDTSPAPIEKASTHRPRDETREDRRARKQAVKAERRMNRSRKKELKTEFGKAERRVANLKDNPPTIPL